MPQAKAKKFYSLAKESALLQFCGFLFNVLSHLSSLSATLQKSTITLAEAHAYLLATQAVLDKYETRFVSVIISIIINMQGATINYSVN